jgi:hypothetical protein
MNDLTAIVRMLKRTIIDGTKRNLTPIARRMLRSHGSRHAIYRAEIARLDIRARSLYSLPERTGRELDAREKDELAANRAQRRYLTRALERC